MKEVPGKRPEKMGVRDAETVGSKTGPMHVTHAREWPPGRKWGPWPALWINTLFYANTWPRKPFLLETSKHPTEVYEKQPSLIKQTQPEPSWPAPARASFLNSSFFFRISITSCCIFMLFSNSCSSVLFRIFCLRGRSIKELREEREREARRFKLI